MEQFDGYVRLRPREARPIRASATSNTHGALLFIDVDGPSLEIGDVQASFRDVLQRLATTRYVLIRWPGISAAYSAAEEQRVQEEVQTMTDAIGASAAELGLAAIWVGMVRFRVGEVPVVTWATGERPDLADELLLKRALEVEFATILEAGHAIWRPTGYHFELPSGDHTGTFVRVADAFRTPRDVRVLSSWLSPRLTDGLAIVADSASLIPLITDLHAVMRKRDWHPGRTEILDEYPRTRLDVLRVVRKAQEADGGVLGLVSVSGSGRLRDLMLDALTTTAVTPNQWAMVVLLEKDGVHVDATFQPAAVGTEEDRIATWLGLTYQIYDPASARRGCPDCRSNERAQVVRIDPRSFETLAFPGVLPVTPDVTAARQSVHFWQACDVAEAVGVEVKPVQKRSIIARSKRVPLAIRIDFDDLLADSNGVTLRDALTDRLSQLNRSDGDGVFRRPEDNPLAYEAIDGVLISNEDDSDVLRSKILPCLFAGTGLSGARVLATNERGEAPSEVSTWRSALAFSLGSVSGWNMRQLQLQVERAWEGQRHRVLKGLVLHARPPSEREWISLGRSYRDELRAVWLTYLPLRSPLLEESDHIMELERAQRGRLSPDAVEFRSARLRYCRPRRNTSWRRRLADFSAHSTIYDPHAVFWGSPSYGNGAERVRTESNFGFEVRALTAYAAMGAAIHRTRQKAVADDPRLRVFEMPAIARSYYDAILVAAVLRWCEPHEAWWGETPRAAENSISDLLARTREPADQKILFPELLLAASMGKLPRAGARLIYEELANAGRGWAAHDQAPIELGRALLRASQDLD